MNGCIGRRGENPRKARQTYLLRKAEEFNKQFPVGTEVLLRKDCGELFRTKIKHPAYVMQGHSAVAHFEGVSGCYSIEGGRVQLAPVQEQEEHEEAKKPDVG